MKIVTILGARPQFIKAAPVSLALRSRGCEEYILHTGQHYDDQLSQLLFDELGLPQPQKNLNVGSGSQAYQTAQMMVGVEEVLEQVKPDWALVYGDTNSTLAGALAAVKLHIPIAHIEAGLRSYNRQMPEEHNRVLTDHCSDLLLCPTQTAVENLRREGLVGGQPGVYWVGDVMYDAAVAFSVPAQQASTILADLNLAPKGYDLATIHRAYNTDDHQRLSDLLLALERLEIPVILPLHPRTRAKMQEFGLSKMFPGIRFIPPVGYLDMLILEKNAKMILTDSGGVQKEAFFFGVPCLTLRPETEWVETVQAGWNRIVDANPEMILQAARRTSWPVTLPPQIFGDGHAAHHIVERIFDGR